MSTVTPGFGLRERGLFGQQIVELDDPELVRLVELAIGLARQHLAEHAHKYAPKKFTQPQLLACLILKAHLGYTYRKCEQQLTLMPAVRTTLGLEQVPRFTTLQAFADRPEIMTLLDAVLASIGRTACKARSQDEPIEVTGVDMSIASVHVVCTPGLDPCRAEVTRQRELENRGQIDLK